MAFCARGATRAREDCHIYERRHVLGYEDVRGDTYQGRVGVLLIWTNLMMSLESIQGGTVGRGQRIFLIIILKTKRRPNYCL